MKLLMHACCAPCSVYCIDELRKEKIEPTIFWYNPNIHPYKEYEARRDCLIEYTKSIDVQCIVKDEYGLEEFCKNVSNNLESRCVDYCYPVRLRKTFEYAKEHGYDAVSTTLLYSIYQKHDYIKLLCENLSKEFRIEFLYRDFRYGFWEGHDKAKEAGLYMQKYCGCVFSEEDRYVKKKKDDLNLPEGFVWKNNKKGEHNEELCEKKMSNIIWKDRKRTIFGLPISFTKYTLTEEKLIIDTGVLAKNQEEVRLYRMTDFSVRQTVFNRLFNIGRINISSSDNTQGEFTLWGVKKPYMVKDILSDCVEKEREKKGIVTNEFLK